VQKFNPIFPLGIEYAGKSHVEKIADLRRYLAEQKGWIKLIS
jgi:hypothetical protein